VGRRRSRQPAEAGELVAMLAGGDAADETVDLGLGASDMVAVLRVLEARTL
jgi:hypothetical protein